MKILAENIFKSFSNEFCFNFIKTCLCNTIHPEFGKHSLTYKQLENSPKEYKDALFKNIIRSINSDIIFTQDGLNGDLSEPLVGGALIQMLYKFNIDGSHDLNRRLKYPELMEIVDKLELEKPFLSPKMMAAKVNSMTKDVKSKMTYKAGFVYECLGYEV